MAVYRPRRRVSAAAIGVTVVVVAVLVILLFFATRRAVAPSDPLIEARAKVLEAANALDVFIVEYPKSTSSGAGPALARAKSAFEAAHADLARSDAAATNRIEAGLANLDKLVAAKGPASEVTVVAEAVKGLLLDLGNGK